MVYLEIKGVRKNKIVSQCEFRKAIYLEWTDPKNYWKNINNKRSIEEENDNDTETIATRPKNERKERVPMNRMIPSKKWKYGS